MRGKAKPMGAKGKSPKPRYKPLITHGAMAYPILGEDLKEEGHHGQGGVNELKWRHNLGQVHE